MTTTALDIIKRALRLLGVLETGGTPSGNDSTDALRVLNCILGSWSNEEYMNYATTTGLYSITANDGEYTIGASGADITAQRPISIDSAFVRDSANDYTLEIINDQTYQSIYDKTLVSTYPCYLYYNPTFPNGTIKLWPIPSKNLYLSITQRNQISEFTLVSTSMSLPRGYESALGYALAAELAPEYGRPAMEFRVLADKEKGLIKSINEKMIVLSCDNDLLAQKEYDINSDRFYS